MRLSWVVRRQRRDVVGVPMDKLVQGAIYGVAFGAVFAALAVLVLAKALKPLPCPGCGRPTPLVRRLASLRPLLRGGPTCPGCGGELDASGQRVRA